MATQVEQATRRREAEHLRQQRRAGGAPSAAAVAPQPEPAEQVLVIAYEEPDESAWELRGRLSPVRTSAATQRVTVRLGKALAQLPEGDRDVELTDDPQEMREHVDFCFTVSGWEAVQETYVRLREARRISPVTTACYDAADDAVSELAGQLEAVENRARQIINSRLESSREDLLLAAETFLTGLDIRQIGLGGIDRRVFRRALTLRPGPHIEALRDLLRDLVPLDREIAAARERYRQIERGPRFTSVRARLLAERADQIMTARVRRARRVHETSRIWPLTAWLTDLEPRVSDADLLDRVIDEIVLVRDSIAAVKREASQFNDWPRATVTAEQHRRGVEAPVLSATDLGPNPFTQNMRDPRGPWRYPLMIGRALDELGYAAPSPVASAAQEAMGGATATGLVWMMNGGTAVLGVVFPPAGVVLGSAMAVWNLMIDLDERATKKAAYRAVLDPSQSLDVEPSLRGVIAGVIGVVGSVVPGWGGFVVGSAEVVVRLTGEDG
jgi:hypothetical protein